jgi:transglutaminase-like putative cysteine protease
VNFAIRYTTTYAYDGPVTDNLNALRVRPATTSTQRVDEFSVRITPETRLHRHTDYFGTDVIEFGVHKPHERLEIDVRARVVTSDPAPPPDTTWTWLRTPSYEEAAGEFLLPLGEPRDDTVLQELLAPLRATSSPLSALRLLCELVPDRFEYRAGATYVGSTVDDLLEAGAGVCQDFVHLSLVLLRRCGIAARYVSGYLWAAPEDGGKDSLELETHAWLEALLPGGGERGEPVWIGADPTNRRLASETHVKIGHGRHYADVPPVKGLFRGTASAELDAAVTMTRLDPTASAAA